jgi:hypothetical protein
MQNPIPKSNLFATSTLAEIQDFISHLPSKEQANANLVLMFTLNACHKMVNDTVMMQSPEGRLAYLRSQMTA